MLSRNTGTGMDTRQAFRTTYGRLCSLCAQALNADPPYHERAVYLASIGRNKAKDATLREIAAQHGRLTETIRAAGEAGLTTVDLHPIVVDTKAIVEQEWQTALHHSLGLRAF